jgi:thiol-disulfide isomerase/thioredoxin
MKNNKTLLLIFPILISLSLTSCVNNEKQHSEESNSKEVLIANDSLNSNILNTLIDDPENEGEKMLLGLVNQEGFTNNLHFPWMNDEFEVYKPNPSKISEIKKLMNGVSLEVFMGTWCEDSQREIPRLYKILHNIEFNFSFMTVVAVSHDKDTPNGLEKGFELEYVPTIMFIKNGKELNRIVEYTQGDTLEDDIITILNGETYTPAYTE